MPNAAEVRALGDLLSLYAGNASTRQPMPPMWTPCSSYHHSLWALPAKTAAVAAAGHRQRLCSAVERASSFRDAAKQPPLFRVCCCWRYYRPDVSALFLCRTGSSAYRSGSDGTGAGGLIRANYCVAHWRAGWAATGTAGPYRGFGQPPRSTISAPDCVNVT